MNRVERILAKNKRENISFNNVTDECINVVIRVSQHIKRIVPLNEEESNLFLGSL